MATAPDTITGTITLTSGSAAFTTSGVNMITRGHLPGDTIMHNGFVLIIATITGENVGTLLDVCPAGAAGAAVPVRIRFQPDGSRVAAQARNLIDLLGNGNLLAEAGLTGAADKISYYTGVSTKALATLTSWARGLLNNPDVSNARIYLGLLELATRSSTAYARGILDNPDAANTRVYLGAQAALGFTPANKAGDTLTGDLAIAKASPTLSLNKSSGVNALRGLSGGTLRWQFEFGDSAAEAGGNAGSNLYLRRFDDGGTQLSIPFSIDRATGITTIADNLKILGSGSAQLDLVKNGTTSCLIRSFKGGALRWQMDFGDGEAEAGGNSGSNWYLRRYDDAGNPTGLVLAINRASGAGSWGGNFAVAGTLSKAAGTFDIEHPLDPERRLVHGFVEAPRYDLIYRGVAKLVKGRAMVNIDDDSNMTAGTFAALTTNAVVTSLQNQDGFARLRPGKIKGADFEIICEDETCTDKVSWVVIAERNDKFVKSAIDPNTDKNGRFNPEPVKK